MWAGGQAGNTELFQLGEVALPSREGGADGDGVLCVCGGGVYSGRFQTGRSLRARSQEQPLVSQGTWELETQSRQSSQGTSVLALPRSAFLRDTG